MKIRELHHAPGFTGEFVVRQRVTDGQFRLYRVPAGWARDAADLAGALEVFNPVVVRRHNEREGDLVTGREAGERVRVAHGKIHRHRGHVAGNFLVPDSDAA